MMKLARKLNYKFYLRHWLRNVGDKSLLLSTPNFGAQNRVWLTVQQIYASAYFVLCPVHFVFDSIIDAKRAIKTKIKMGNPMDLKTRFFSLANAMQSICDWWWSDQNMFCERHCFKIEMLRLKRIWFCQIHTHTHEPTSAWSEYPIFRSTIACWSVWCKRASANCSAFFCSRIRAHMQAMELSDRLIAFYCDYTFRSHDSWMLTLPCQHMVSLWKFLAIVSVHSHQVHIVNSS